MDWCVVLGSGGLGSKKVLELFELTDCLLACQLVTAGGWLLAWYFVFGWWCLCGTV